MWSFTYSSATAARWQSTNVQANRALSHPSSGRTTRRLPKLGGCRLPIEGVVARAVLFQVIEPRDRLLDAGPVAGRHPPHHEIRPIEMLEPFWASLIETLVQGQINEAFEGFHTLPNR